MTRLFFITGVLLCIAVSSIHSDDDISEDHNDPIPTSPVFQTSSGPVQGQVIKNGNKYVNAFLGIPYAKPPLGRLRFKPPENVDPWTSVLKAIKPMPACYQQLPTSTSLLFREMRMTLLRPWSEDCLHLNIWAPFPKPEKVPVIFFIHGGAFILGSGLMLTDGTTLSSEGTIVVTFNYRLNAFGFFSLGNKDAPGTVGLMDQNLALQWVRNNIAVFGGDPERITLTGMSAGSASVGYHLLSPKSRGLFKSAILMSGAPTNWWAISEPEASIEMSTNLLKSLGCHGPNLTTSLQCLQEKDPEDIIDSISKSSLSLQHNFVPTVDGEFLTEHPQVSVASGRFNPADVIVGTAIDEGGMFVVVHNLDVFKTKDGRVFRHDLQKVIKGAQPDLSDLQVRVLDTVYTEWTSPDDPLLLRNALKDIYSDSIMDCRINEFADKLAEAGNSVYRYVFDYTTPNPFTPTWAGAIHGQDQMPILGPAQMLKQMGIDLLEHPVCKRFRRHFLNFAASGNPNLEREEYPNEPEWPKYDSQKKLLNFAEKSSVQTQRRLLQCAVWLDLLPLLRDNKCSA